MTMTLEIENSAVLNLIKQLENLQMLSIVNSLEKPKVDWRKFRGSVSKQPREDIDRQLKELRNEWERTCNLESLVAGINENNIHEEVSFGKPVGKEIW